MIFLDSSYILSLIFENDLIRIRKIKGIRNVNF